MIFRGEFRDKSIPPKWTEARFRRLVDWEGHRNLYADKITHFGLYGLEADPPPPNGKGLEEWTRLWPDGERDSLEGAIRFQGGDLLSRALTNPLQLKPEHFRLRPDSAGYRAGPDGKDLGADVDLVGPGPAYERWKKTPEYQQWLDEVAQSMPLARNGNATANEPPVATKPPIND